MKQLLIFLGLLIAVAGKGQITLTSIDENGKLDTFRVNGVLAYRQHGHIGSAISPQWATMETEIQELRAIINGRTSAMNTLHEENLELRKRLDSLIKALREERERQAPFDETHDKMGMVGDTTTYPLDGLRVITDSTGWSHVGGGVGKKKRKK